MAFLSRSVSSIVIVFLSAFNAQADDYLKMLLEQEDKDGRFLTEQYKQDWHNGREYFVNLHRYKFKDVNHWMEKQVYLNSGKLLLGAASIGLDALPIEGFSPEILDDELGLIEKGFTGVIIIALGRRGTDDFNASLPKSRLPDTKVFSEI